MKNRPTISEEASKPKWFTKPAIDGLVNHFQKEHHSRNGLINHRTLLPIAQWFIKPYPVHRARVCLRERSSKKA